MEYEEKLCYTPEMSYWQHQEQLTAYLFNTHQALPCMLSPSTVSIYYHTVSFFANSYFSVTLLGEKFFNYQVGLLVYLKWISKS